MTESCGASSATPPDAPYEYIVKGSVGIAIPGSELKVCIKWFVTSHHFKDSVNPKLITLHDKTLHQREAFKILFPFFTDYALFLREHTS